MHHSLKYQLYPKAFPSTGQVLHILLPDIKTFAMPNSVPQSHPIRIQLEKKE